MAGRAGRSWGERGLPVTPLKPRKLTLGVGDVVGIAGTARRCRIIRADEPGQVGVRDLTGGQTELVPIAKITHAPAEEGAPAPRPADVPEVAGVTDETWAEAKKRLEAIAPLRRWRRPPKALVRARAQEVGRHWTRLYAWMRAYRDGGEVLTALLPGRPSVPKGSKKLSTEVEHVMQDCIDSHYLTKQKLRPSAVDVELGKRCKKMNLPKPHINTLRRRIARLRPHKANSRRHGPEAGERDLPQTGRLVARYPLEIVQVDHTLVDVILVDGPSANVMGRPWITVAIDVFSRMIVGYYVALENPGALGTGMCVSHAILPKEQWMEERGLRLMNGTPAEWPAYGLPTTLHMDNAREFRGEMIRRACEQYGIDVQFRPVRRPKFGAHIESLMHKLAGEFRTLPGATFSNPQDRGKAYDSQKEAVLTIEEFDRWLANHICCIYHYRTHSGIETSPIKRWEQGLFEGTELAPPVGQAPDRFVGEDADRLRKDFLPFEERTVRNFGVVVDKIHYYHRTLRKWINARDPDNPKRKRQFIFRINPNDISIIYFLNPETDRYEPIPYRDISRPPMTLWEFRAARRTLRDQGHEDQRITESMIFEARERNSRIIEEARARKKKVKAKGRFRGGVHGTAGATSRSEAAGDEPILRRAEIRAFDDVDLG